MRWRIPFTILVLLAVGFATWYQRSRNRQIENVQRDVMSAVKVGETVQPLAGMSARAKIDVRAIDPRRIGKDTLSAGYHRYMNRCHTCHDAPDPTLFQSIEWPSVLDRMHANMRAAGTIGLNEEDRAAILRFLMRNAGR